MKDVLKIIDDLPHHPNARLSEEAAPDRMPALCASSERKMDVVPQRSAAS
jgi:hypothetical protein